MMRLSALRLALFITFVFSIVNAPAFASEPLKIEEIDHADLTDLLYGELNEEWDRDLQMTTLTPTSSPTPSVEIGTPTAMPSPSVTSGALKMAPYAAHAAVGMAILVSMALMS